MKIGHNVLKVLAIGLVIGLNCNLVQARSIQDLIDEGDINAKNIVYHNQIETYMDGKKVFTKSTFTLNLNDKNLDSLEGLFNLKNALKISMITLMNNELTEKNLSPLFKLVNLERIYLENNKLKNFPIKILGKLKALESLGLQGNKIDKNTAKALEKWWKLNKSKLRIDEQQ